MLKAKTKTRKFRKISDDLKSDVKAPLVEALEKFYKNPMMQFHIPGHTGGRASYQPFKKLVGNRALLLTFSIQSPSILNTTIKLILLIKLLYHIYALTPRTCCVRRSIRTMIEFV